MLPSIKANNREQNHLFYLTRGDIAYAQVNKNKCSEEIHWRVFILLKLIFLNKFYDRIF